MPTVLITGASRGLGLEFVRHYAKENWAVIALCRHPAQAGELQALMDKYNNVRIEALDVTDMHSLRILSEKLGDTEIDVLINNAGIFSGGSFSGSATKVDEGQQFGTIDAEAWDKVLRTNTIAPIMAIETLMPQLHRGRDVKVVNITSRMGSIDEMGPGYLAYRTSKAALNAAMCVIAHDLKAKGITVINMHPGWVKTDMGGQEAPLDPPTSIAGMTKVIAGLSLEDTGKFFSYDGRQIPW